MRHRRDLNRQAVPDGRHSDTHFSPICYSGESPLLIHWFACLYKPLEHESGPYAEDSPVSKPLILSNTWTKASGFCAPPISYLS